MDKAVILSRSDEHHRAQAQSYLAEAQRILRQLANDRGREERRRTERGSILNEVKSILHAR